MGRISGAILSSDLPGGPPEVIAQATAWAQKGLDVVFATRQLHPNKYEECELAYLTLLFNIAVIRQVSCILLFFFLTFNRLTTSCICLVIGRGDRSPRIVRS